MKNLCFLFFLIFLSNGYAQNTNKIYTEDIDNFWMAYDKIIHSDSYGERLAIINKFYIEPGSKGLHAFLKARDYNDSLYIELIESYPKFWNSVRPNTLFIKNRLQDLKLAVNQLKEIYPDLEPAEMYFTIGGLRSGGTVNGNMVLVGAEIAVADSLTDVSEFDNDWLKSVFAKQSLNNIVYLNVHEYIHTQQTGYGNTVLSKSIHEGACDFIAELVLNEPIQTQYIDFGRANNELVKSQFEIQMLSENISNWLYNGAQKGEMADLGYYIGYEICKSYFSNASNKSKAIKDIIELDLEDGEAVIDFLDSSRYFDEPVDRDKLLALYSKECPEIIGILPFENGANEVDPLTDELRISFSKEMVPGSMSISFSENGEQSVSEKAKSNMPIKNVKDYENNDKTLVLGLSLEPNRKYEFLITNKSFKSKDGYPLASESFLICFSTN